MQKDGKIGYINTKGKLVISPTYSVAEGFSNGLARVFDNGKWYYINKEGEVAFACVYNVLSDFSEGYATVIKGNKSGVIDKSGNEVIPCIFDNLSNFSSGLAKATIGKEDGFIDIDGYFIGKGYVKKISNEQSQEKEELTDVKSNKRENVEISHQQNELEENDTYQFIDKNRTFYLKGTGTYLIFIPNNKYGGKANVVWASSAGNSFTYDIKDDGSIHLHDGRNMFYSRYKESVSDIVLQYDKNNQFLFYISGGEKYIYRVTQKKLLDHFYY